MAYFPDKLTAFSELLRAPLRVPPSLSITIHPTVRAFEPIFVPKFIVVEVSRVQLVEAGPSAFAASAEADRPGEVEEDPSPQAPARDSLGRTDFDVWWLRKQKEFQELAFRQKFLAVAFRRAILGLRRAADDEMAERNRASRPLRPSVPSLFDYTTLAWDTALQVGHVATALPPSCASAALNLPAR